MAVPADTARSSARVPRSSSPERSSSVAHDVGWFRTVGACLPQNLVLLLPADRSEPYEHPVLVVQQRRRVPRAGRRRRPATARARRTPRASTTRSTGTVPATTTVIAPAPPDSGPEPAPSSARAHGVSDCADGEHEACLRTPVRRQALHLWTVERPRPGQGRPWKPALRRGWWGGGQRLEVGACGGDGWEGRNSQLSWFHKLAV